MMRIPLQNLLIKSTLPGRTPPGEGMRGKMKYSAQKSPKLETALFLTLFWMVHYPTLLLLGSLVDIHPRTLVHILKRMTVTLHLTLEDEVKWPADAIPTDSHHEEG